MRPQIQTALWCAVSILAACRSPSVASDAGALAPQVMQVDAGPIDATQVAQWVRYAGLLAAQGPAVDADGGPLPTAQVLARAGADEAMRRDAGLSEAQVDAIEDLVAEVVAARGTLKLTGADALADFEKVAAKMPFEQRKKAEAALAELKAGHQAPVSLAPLEAKYGKPAVDAVLASEAQVTQAWERLMNLAGEAR